MQKSKARISYQAKSIVAIIDDQDFEGESA